MLVIKKDKNKKAEVINITRKQINSLKQDGYDFVPCFDNVYAFLSYKETFEDDNFNCQVVTPEKYRVFCFGDFFIVKKNFFGVVSFKKNEIEHILSLITEEKPEHWWN